MSNAAYLKALLRPLGVYGLEGTINAASLEAKGAALDGVQDWLEVVGRESDLTTAENWGLELWKGLFDRLPAAKDAESMRQAIAALLRIGSGGFTLPAIRDTLAGCGMEVTVEESGTGTVKLGFPGTAGEPENFDAIRKNIEAILPAHVAAEYVFNYLTWEMLESYNWTFRIINSLTWHELETAI